MRFWNVTEQDIKKIGFSGGVYFYQARILKNPPHLSIHKRKGLLMPRLQEESTHSKTEESPFQERNFWFLTQTNPKTTTR